MPLIARIQVISFLPMALRAVLNRLAGYVQYDHAGNFLRFGTGNAERTYKQLGSIGFIGGDIDTTSGSEPRCYQTVVVSYRARRLLHISIETQMTET